MVDRYKKTKKTSWIDKERYKGMEYYYEIAAINKKGSIETQSNWTKVKSIKKRL